MLNQRNEKRRGGAFRNTKVVYFRREILDSIIGELFSRPPEGYIIARRDGEYVQSKHRKDI